MTRLPPKPNAQPAQPQMDVRMAYLEAERALGAGQHGFAEVICRRILEQQPSHAEAHNLVGRVLMSLGAWSLAARSFRLALRANPHFKSATKNLQDAEARAAAQLPAGPADRPRYLVIREWTEGFWSDVDHVLGMCVFAEITGRTPVVHWGAQSRYRTAESEEADSAHPPSRIDAWSRFFAPVSAATIEDVLNAAATKVTQADGSLRPCSIFPARFAADPSGRAIIGPLRNRWSGPESRLTGQCLLGRQDDIVVSDFHTSVVDLLPYVPEDHPIFGTSIRDARRIAVDRYLKPQADIVAEVDAFARQHFGSAPILGVHLRGTDKVTEQPDLAAINARYPAAIARAMADRPDMRIFLMTDSEPFVAQCRAQFGDRVITTQAARTGGNVGLHYIQRSGDRTHLGKEVLVDTLLGARCDRFIGLATSNVSVFVRDLKAWPAGTCELFSQAYTDRPNLAIHRIPPPAGST